MCAIQTTHFAVPIVCVVSSVCGYTPATEENLGRLLCVSSNQRTFDTAECVASSVPVYIFLCVCVVLSVHGCPPVQRKWSACWLSHVGYFCCSANVVRRATCCERNFEAGAQCGQFPHHSASHQAVVKKLRVSPLVMRCP